MEPIQPMEPLAHNTIPDSEDWIAQVKWDGVRILTYVENGATRLFNRKKHERTMNYPELLDHRSFCKAESVILDGEMIALGADGNPSFHEVMRRDGIRRKDRLSIAREQVRVTYMIFDVIFLNGNWVHQQTFTDRTNMLRSIIKPKDNIQLVRCHDDGKALFEVVIRNGMEGIVLKRKSSPYLLGKKKEWLKVKNYRDLIAPIGGFTLNKGIVNAVLLGLYDNSGRLIYIGHSGKGKLTNREWRELTDVLKPMAIHDKPFANKPERINGVYWVEPILSVKVKYAEWTSGRSLRQPCIEGFVQVDPKECLIDKELM